MIMPKRTTQNKPKTGTLRIGNQWNAINIIARSQTHPLKAVCELAENAIDAQATCIQIVRRRSKGSIYLELADDGNGVLSDDQGEPDFGRIATHVCDSMKRHLDAGERAGIHGEFGIGLLSFWSLGDELRMVSAGADGRLFELFLQRGKRTYAVRHVRGALATGGTRVVVGPLLESTRKVVTGDKLVRYLSSELRDRIRASGVQIRVVDRVSRKEALVEPREFEGDRVDVAERLPTAFGDVTVELYFREANSVNETEVALCKDGTRVLHDIAELVSFQYAPWTESRVEGILDFGAFELAPGTRGGIVPDEKLNAFSVAIKEFEPLLVEAIDMREKAESDKASRDILKQVHRAFRNALRELPSNEYLFFDIPDLKPSVSASTASKNAGTGGEEALSLSRQAEQAPGNDPHSSDQTLLPLQAGPLASVRITPRHARRAPGEECLLTAVARDGQGLKVDADVRFEWRLMEGTGSINSDKSQTRVSTDAVGQLFIDVVAIQGDNTAIDQVVVKFVEDAHRENDDSAKGLPSYRLEAEHGKPWRSRYHARKNEIIINSAHRDFVSSRSTAAKHRRYIGKLYAKEVVLINFPHESPAEVMERLIQITLRTEDVL